MRILLTTQRIECESNQIDFSHGIGYLTAVLREAGHKVKVLEADATVTDVDSIKKVLREEDCDLIGIGGISSAFPAIEWMVEYVRKVRDTPIVLGGGVLTSNPNVIFDYLKPDYGIIGEGELAVVAIANGTAEGLIKFPVIKDLDSLPYPAWDDFDIEGIIERSRPIAEGRRRLSILSSRSCPFLCSFCFHTTGNTYRRRSPRSVVNEMKELINRYGAEHFRFADELFAWDEKWVTQFCRMVIDENVKATWECAGKPGYVPVKALPLMKEAGCESAGLGFETGSDIILKSMKKKTTIAGAKKAIQQYRDAGIYVNGSFMCGDPMETPETIQETADFIIEMKLDHVVWMGFMTPYPGSEIYRKCLERGLITDEIKWLHEIGNSTALRLNLTSMEDNELIRLRNKAIDDIREALHLNPYDISDEAKTAFMKATTGLTGRVFVTPVGEHTRISMHLIRCCISGFLDSDKIRSERKFNGYPVYMRTPENIVKLEPDWVLLTAKLNLRDIIKDDLIKCGVDENKIISLI